MQRLLSLLTGMALGVALTLGGVMVSNPASSTPPAPSNAELKATLRQLLKEEPRLVVEALEAYRQQLEDEEQAQTTAAIKENREKLINPIGAVILGNPAGSETFVEFIDYRCPYCKKMEPAIIEAVKQSPNLKRIVRLFPILGMDSLKAAQGVFAATQQGKAAELHNALMEYPGQLNETALYAEAKKIGLNIDQLKKDMASDTTEQALQQNLKLGQTIGVNGTPAFVIGDRFIPGATDAATLLTVIREEYPSQAPAAAPAPAATQP